MASWWAMEAVIGVGRPTYSSITSCHTIETSALKLCSETGPEGSGWILFQASMRSQVVGWGQTEAIGQWWFVGCTSSVLGAPPQGEQVGMDLRFKPHLPLIPGWSQFATSRSDANYEELHGARGFRHGFIPSFTPLRSFHVRALWSPQQTKSPGHCWPRRATQLI